jgi:hypothetical protein
VNVVQGETLCAHPNLSWSGCAESVHSNHITVVAHILAPASRHACFDCKSCARCWRKNRVAILLRLGLEQLPARHGYNSDADPVLGQFLAGCNNQTDFRPGGDQDDVRFAIGSIGQNIRSAPQTIRRGKLGAVKHGHILPCRDKRDWPISGFNGDTPATAVSFASHGRMTINRGIARNDANDFILKAVVVAATKVPRVNASFAGDAVIEYGDIHLSAPAATAAGSPLSGEKAVKFSDWKRRRARSDALLSCEGRLFP